MIPMY